MKKRKAPLRKCISCSENKQKKDLIRVVKTNEGDILADFTGKVNGRGAYICPSEECLNNAINSNKISKSLGVDISKEVKDKLIKDVKDRLKI